MDAGGQAPFEMLLPWMQDTMCRLRCAVLCASPKCVPGGEIISVRQ
jgi:hypothetical protein